MEQFIMKGGNPLVGEVTIGGAKNAALGILTAAIMTDDDVLIENLPDVRDINVMLEAIEEIGATVERIDRHTAKINASSIHEISVDDEYIRKIRASYYFIGALLGKYKSAQVPLPGGCNIGSRPIDQHLKGFRALGGDVRIENGAVRVHAIDLVGSHIYLDVVSVGATINIMMAAALAEGMTILENVAKEPHVVDVANFLNSMGANIKDLAELLEELDENNRLVVFRLLKKEVATEAFAYMSDEARDDLVNAFSDVELVGAIEEMSLDDAADLLEDMPAGVVKRVLEKSSKQTRESLNKLLNYPESSAGSLMTPEYVRLREDMTVAQAFEAIRKQGENAETVYTCYVVERNRLKGVVSARSLLLAEPHTSITEIMDDNVVTVKVTDDQEYVAREMQRYDFTAMPVLDNEGMFVGIITIDDAIDVLTDESTEDMQKMAAILPDDDATTYFGTSVWTHAKQRIPWLLILMLSATFTGMVTTHYEQAFVSLPLLVSFMPMLMDTAGNCGNQISTLMVRGLALGEVEPSDFVKVLGKELRVSAIVGAVLGIVNGLRIYLMYTFLFPGQYQNVMGYAIVVSVSLFFSVILAKLVGGMLPLAAKKLGADPAIMATPFITTIVDACSLILYFQIAQLVFRNMM